jgi:hypothetical protein
LDLEQREEVAKGRRQDLEMSGLGVSHINQRHAERNYDIEREVGLINQNERVDMIVNSKDDPHLRRPTRNVCYFEMPTRKKDATAETDKPPEASAAPAKAGEDDDDAAEPDLGEKLGQEHSYDLGLDLNTIFVEKANPPVLCPSPSIVRMQDQKRIRGNAASYSLDEYLHIKQSAQEV